MPIVNGKYVNPVWINESSPAINSSELNAISETLEKLDKANFVPQILVDANISGALVTVTNGSTVLSQTYRGATLAFDLDDFGIWTVTMTQSSQTSGSITVNVTEVKQYPVMLSFFSASIAVTYPQGSTLTATNGTTVLTATDTSGNFTFIVPSAGTWTIVSTDGTNTASTEVLISTEGQVKTVIISSYTMVASTSAISGVSYETGTFKNYGWDYDLLNDMAKAISQNKSITNRTTAVYIDRGAEHYKLSVGDEIAWLVGGVDGAMLIMGFNHDTLSSSTAYGETTATEKAGLSLGMEHCLNDKYIMGLLNSTGEGWARCYLKIYIFPELLEKMTSMERSIIKTVDKKYNLGGNNLSTISTSEDTFFIPSVIEVSGNVSDAYAEGEQYAYYLAGNSAIKYVKGVSESWWLRTAGSATAYNFVSSRGYLGDADANLEMAVSIMFCV